MRDETNMKRYVVSFLLAYEGIGQIIRGRG